MKNFLLGAVLILSFTNCAALGYYNYMNNQKSDERALIEEVLRLEAEVHELNKVNVMIAMYKKIDKLEKKVSKIKAVPIF